MLRLRERGAQARSWNAQNHAPPLPGWRRCEFDGTRCSFRRCPPRSRQAHRKAHRKCNASSESARRQNIACTKPRGPLTSVSPRSAAPVTATLTDSNAPSHRSHARRTHRDGLRRSRESDGTAAPRRLSRPRSVAGACHSRHVRRDPEVREHLHDRRALLDGAGDSFDACRSARTSKARRGRTSESRKLRFLDSGPPRAGTRPVNSRGCEFANEPFEGTDFPTVRPRGPRRGAAARPTRARRCRGSGAPRRA